MISFCISVGPPKMNWNQTQLDALLAENLVHQFCALGERGTDLVAVDRLSGGLAVVSGQQGDALDGDAVRGQDRYQVCLISRGTQSGPSPAFLVIARNARITLFAVKGCRPVAGPCSGCVSARRCRPAPRAGSPPLPRVPCECAMT